MMFLWLLLSGASALADDSEDDPDEEEKEEEAPRGRSFDLSEEGSETAPGSALDEIEGAVQDTPPLDEGMVALLAETDTLPSALARSVLQIRGQLWLRPLVGAIGARQADNGQSTLSLGAAIGHRWWRLTERALVPGGETRWEINGPTFNANGVSTTLSSTAGVWWGPLGLQVGPALRFERLDWSGLEETVELPAALLGGGRALLSMDIADRLVLVGGVEQTWALTGARSWRTEPGVFGGLAVRRGWFQLRLSGAGRRAGDTDVWNLIAGMHIQPRIK